MSDIWRKRYERERRARQEAEQLLEDKSLELYELNQQQAGEIRQRQKFDVYLLGTARSLLAASVSSPFDSIRATLEQLLATQGVAWVGLEWGRGRKLCLPTPNAGPWPKIDCKHLDSSFELLARHGFTRGLQVASKGIRLIVADGGHDPYSKLQQEFFRDLVSLYGAFYDNWLAFNQLQQAEQETHRMSTLRSRFLAMVTHELRTPMNGVLGCADLLASSKLDAEQAQLLRVLTQSGKSLLALINDVLDYNKIDSDQFCLESKPVDIKALCMDCIEIVRPLASEKSMEIKCRFKGEFPPAVLIDPSRYKQVLLNLLGNAVNHSDKGGVTLGLTMSQEGRRVQLITWVEDSGPGISDDFQKHLFDPFTQETSSKKGTGLGLSISQKLVRRLGGELEVFSELGIGTRFYFALTLEPATLAASESIKESSTKQGNILVAEDTKANQLVVRLILEKAGCQVTIVENGQQALEQAQVKPYDLILMDCSMPVMDGYEATQALRDNGCDVPILALTATTTAESHQMCMASGMNDVLHKPIQKSSLLQAINQWL